MKKNNRIIVIISVFLIMLLSFTKLVNAESTKGTEVTQANGFTIEGVENSHQVTDAKKVGYFYLYEKPSSSDTLKIKIINYANQNKKFDISVTDANNNKNGIIDYTGELKNSKYLEIPFTSLVKWKKKTVEVGAREVKTITIPFKMPNKAYKGVIIGGINVYQSLNNSNKQEGLSMGSRYGYTIGVVLTNSNKKEDTRNISVRLDGVTPRLDYGHKVVQGNILNPHPYIFETKNIQGKITNLKSNKVILHKNLDKVRIAPYQIMPFQFDFGKADMEPGEYLMEIDVVTKQKTWHLEQKFKISKQQADNINKKAAVKVYIPNWLNYLIIILAAIVSILTILTIIRKVKRKHENVK